MTKGSGRGRPTDSFKSLFTDPQRFSVAACSAIAPHIGPHAAARAAIAWVEENTPITIEVVEELLLIAGTSYTAGAATATGSVLDDRARSLVRKVQLVSSRATERELAWLTQSSGLVGALLEFIAQGNSLGVKKSVELLRQAGWEDVPERIGRRLTPALRGGFPPYEGTITTRLRRLLDTMRSSENR